MRVWDIHPGYLSRQSLLGQHAEIHALYAVIQEAAQGRKKGYAFHPETLRWKESPDRLVKIHDLTVREMNLRSYNHASPLAGYFHSTAGPLGRIDTPAQQVLILSEKYRLKEQAGRIPLPKNIYEYWAHHKYSVMARGYDHYKDIGAVLKNKKGCALREAEFLIEKVAAVMEMPVAAPALANVVDHLRGYLKRVASEEEKAVYLDRRPERMDFLLHYFYRLAVKYNRRYLLQSTIFADHTDVFKTF